MSDITITLPRALALALYNRAENEAECPTYGAFIGGDPRDFTPDPECSTAEERAAHKAACEAWAAGSTAPCRADSEGSHDGEVFVHRTRAGFGLGAQIYRDPEMAALAAALRNALEARS